MTNKHGRNGIRCKKHMDKDKEDISGIVLLDACRLNNERKVKDLVKRLSLMSSSEVQLIINHQDHTGRTPLSYACGYGNVTIIEELSKIRRLDPNLGDNELNTPLHFGAQAGHCSAVDLMLVRFHGVIQLNPRNITGLTPLHKAALQGRSRVAKSLIVAGASPAIRDYTRNMSAIDWARLTGRHICCEVILRAARDKHSSSVTSSPPSSFNSPTNIKTFPKSESSIELKRINSDDSPYYHLQNAKNTISSATWLKNKISRAFGNTGNNPGLTSNNSTFALASPTLCAGSLILPSIKPIIEQQRPKKQQKIKIPTVHINHY